MTPKEDQDSNVEFVPGWYYGRQVRQFSPRQNSTTESRDNFVRFSNETPGLSSHLLQGIAIDGKQVTMIRLSGKVRTDECSQRSDARCDAFDCNQFL